jgi:prolyl 4-hydroxylase
MAANPVMAEVEALLAARRFAEAAQRLSSAAAAGDAAALLAFAMWRIAGDIVRRDLPQARALMARAAAAGSRDAALLSATFDANGLGGAADWPAAMARLSALATAFPHVRRQLRLLDAMDLTPAGDPRALPQPEPLSEAPHVRAFPGFLSREECTYLVQSAEPLFRPSLVVDPASGRMVAHPIRVSEAALFGVTHEDPVIAAINRRIAAASGTTAAQGEPLQILRYRAGGEYKAHMDALPAEPNQRTHTLLVYLADTYQGGETHFLRTGLSYRGRTGDALLFRNVTEDGAADPMAQHAGLPVTRGVKLVASRWIRARPFAFPPPRPLLAL